MRARERRSGSGAPPLEPGYRIGGGHVIESVLGQGGFGITYRARSPQGRSVAIKEYCPRDLTVRKGDSLTPLRGSGKAFRSGYRCFKEEAETLRRLPSHPGIVEVMALFEKNNTIYIVMEFIAGEPLIDHLRNGRVYDDIDFRDLLGRVTVALGLLHDHQVLHCDIKPHNIMIRPDGNPVLIDFGAVQDIRRAGQQIEVITKGYAPVEMLNPSVGELGPWSDIFSLGVVGYYMASGEKPPSAFDRVLALEKGKIDPLVACVDRRRSGISEQSARVVDACLRIEPGDRPLSAEMLVRMLRDGRSDPIAAARYGAPRAQGLPQIVRSIKIMHIMPRRSTSGGPSDPTQAPERTAPRDRSTVWLIVIAVLLSSTAGVAVYAFF